jgi:hypothetical protein
MEKQKMITNELLINVIDKRFREKGFAQVSGYNKFVYVGKTDNYFIVGREKGTNAKISISKINAALEAVKIDHSVYSAGPNSLRRFGITHINSPIWAMLHLLTIDEILGLNHSLLTINNRA